MDDFNTEAFINGGIQGKEVEFDVPCPSEAVGGQKRNPPFRAGLCRGWVNQSVSTYAPPIHR